MTEWWRRGRLEWERDVVPLVPFVILGIAAGLFTVWVERRFVGAEGEPFHFSLIERGLIAGRALWFYAGKLLWPVDLVFIYPRWTVNQATWWQYLYPVAAVAILVVAWSMRRRVRWPLAGLLYFAVLCSPQSAFSTSIRFYFHSSPITSNTSRAWG